MLWTKRHSGACQHIASDLKVLSFSLKFSLLRFIWPGKAYSLSFSFSFSSSDSLVLPV